MARKHKREPFTLLVVPHTGRSPVTLRLPPWVINMLLLVAVGAAATLLLFIGDYRNTQAQLAALRLERQADLDRQREMRQTITAQEEEVRRLTAQAERLSADFSSLDRQVNETIQQVRRIVGLDRLTPTSSAIVIPTPTVVTPTKPVPTPMPTNTATPAPTATVFGLPTPMLTATRTPTPTTAIPSPTPTPARSSFERNPSLPVGGADAMSLILPDNERRAALNPSSRGAGFMAVPKDDLAFARRDALIASLLNLLRVRDLAQERVNKVDPEKRSDPAELERQLILYDAAPKIWPVAGPITITSGFGLRKDPLLPWLIVFHYGVDISAWYGTPVLATKDGKVVFAGWNGNLGLTVEIQHEMGYKTVYGHNRELLVRAGDMVKAGQVIARAGETGRATGPHVHYEIQLNNTPLDPMKFLELPGGSRVQTQQ